MTTLIGSSCHCRRCQDSTTGLPTGSLPYADQQRTSPSHPHQAGRCDRRLADSRNVSPGHRRRNVRSCLTRGDVPWICSTGSPGQPAKGSPTRSSSTSKPGTTRTAVTPRSECSAPYSTNKHIPHSPLRRESAPELVLPWFSGIRGEAMRAGGCGSSRSLGMSASRELSVGGGGCGALRCTRIWHWGARCGCSSVGS
jgi:hypothetical protein